MGVRCRDSMPTFDSTCAWWHSKPRFEYSLFILINLDWLIEQLTNHSNPMSNFQRFRQLWWSIGICESSQYSRANHNIRLHLEEVEKLTSYEKFYLKTLCSLRLGSFEKTQLSYGTIPILVNVSRQSFNLNSHLLRKEFLWQQRIIDLWKVAHLSRFQFLHARKAFHHNRERSSALSLLAYNATHEPFYETCDSAR